MEMHFAPRPLVGLDNVAGSKIVSKSGPKIILYCPYEKFLVLRNKSDESTTYYTLGLHNIFLAGEKWEFEFFFEFPLRNSLFFWLLDFVKEPLQLDRIAIRLFNFLHIWFLDGKVNAS